MRAEAGDFSPSPQDSTRPLNELDRQILRLKHLDTILDHDRKPEKTFSLGHTRPVVEAEVTEISHSLGLNGNASEVITSLVADVTKETGIEPHQTGKY